MKWRGDYSEDGRFMIQTARIRHQGTEHQLCESESEDKSGPPYTRSRGIYNTRREVKAAAEALVCARGGPDA